MEPSLNLEEMEPLFAALRTAEGRTLPEALKDLVILARSKGMDAEAFERMLSGYGINSKPKFHDWLKQEFALSGDCA